MPGTYRCNDCGAYFEATRRECTVCDPVGTETALGTCRNCGASLVDSSTQRCPVCGSTDVERA